MFQQAIFQNIQKFLNFLMYAKSYIERHNMFKTMLEQFETKLREALTMRKKAQIAQYRVNYQKFRLNQMEKLIAESNQHSFLKGNKIDRLR